MRSSGLGELMASANVAEITIPNDQVVRVPAAEAVSSAILHGQAIVDDIVRVALTDHMPLQGALDAVVNRRRVGLGIQKDAMG